MTPRPDASVTPRDAAVTPADASLDAEVIDAGTVDEQIVRGQAIYTTHCSLCHGASGEGYAADNAPALANPDYLSIASDAFLEAAIRDGRPGTPMSAWGASHDGPLSTLDVLDLVALLRSWSTLPFEDVSSIVVSGNATAGATHYARECASCHGASGEGSGAVTLNNANFHDTASDGFIRRTIERGRRGTPMASFAEFLTATEIDDVVAFVRTLREEPEPEELPVEDPPTLETIVINEGGTNPSFTLRDGRYVPAADVKAALDAGQRIILLDARASSDWVTGHIPGAAPYPFYDSSAISSSLPDDDTWIVAYCACPHAASGRVVDDLRALGFEHTAVLDEGINFWREAGYPMARGRLP